MKAIVCWFRGHEWRYWRYDYAVAHEDGRHWECMRCGTKQNVT